MTPENVEKIGEFIEKMKTEKLHVWGKKGELKVVLLVMLEFLLFKEEFDKKEVLSKIGKMNQIYLKTKKKEENPGPSPYQRYIVNLLLI